MYAGALIPGLLLVGLYLLFIAGVALIKPAWVPALPQEARIYRETTGASGHRSLLALMVVCAVAGVVWSRFHGQIINPMVGRTLPAPGDEIFIMSMTVASFLALALAIANSVLRLGLLSKLAQQVTCVLIPSLVLIFLGGPSPPRAAPWARWGRW
jgi:TRAP-type mannitol/chloroaromatic compound transport system permease large subunit